MLLKKIHHLINKTKNRLNDINEPLKILLQLNDNINYLIKEKDNNKKEIEMIKRDIGLIVSSLKNLYESHNNLVNYHNHQTYNNYGYDVYSIDDDDDEQGH